VTSGGRARELCLDVLPLSALDARSGTSSSCSRRPSLALPQLGLPRRLAKKNAGVAPAAKLQQELLATREYLQAIIEEQETTNEELKAANEEACRTTKSCKAPMRSWKPPRRNCNPPTRNW